jgi:Domain of unknown function (DU1801)
MKKAAKKTAKSRVESASASAGVSEYLALLDHPRKPVVEALRELVLGVSPAIEEGIKWSSPSFRTREWFATLNLRARGGEERVWLVLHLGAKVKGEKSKPFAIADPTGLLEWFAPDRALVCFDDLKDVRRKRGALEAILRQWIGHV